MTSEKTSKAHSGKTDESVAHEKMLILYNDDIHSFDYVIAALVEVCDHEYCQASQCATITHYKGKCDIKKGDLARLKPMKDALIDRELSVTID